MKKYFLLLAFWCTVLIAYSQQAGDLDLNFAGKGWTPLFIGESGNVDEETSTKLLTLPDGKYITVIYNYTSDYTVLVKHKSDGTIDSSFGRNGFTDPIKLSDAKTATLQNVDGDIKILVAGSFDKYEYANFGLTRINSNGTVDTTFGVGGKVTTDLNGYQDDVLAICIQTISDIDKILMAGRATNGSGYTDFAMARYSANGVLDATFGTGGKVLTDFNAEMDEAHVIFLQPDNKIILAGSASRDFAIARYSSNGVLDAGFGTGGKVTMDFYSNYDEVNAIGIQNIEGLNKIVAAGLCYTPLGSDFAIVRFNDDGSLDLSFDTVGKVMIDFDSGNDMIYDLIIDANNKILLAGEANVAYYTNFAFARIKTDGTPDSSFGTNGLLAFKLGHYMAVARDILMDNDSIMVAGGTRDLTYDFALLRLDALGALVSSFGTGGEVIGYYSSGRSLTVNAIAVQTVNGENKILFAGQVVKEYGYTDFGLTRFNADGSLDTSFGDQGIVLTDFSYGNDDNAVAVAVQNINGVDKIVVAGTSLGYEYNDPNVAVCRYNADGTPDESFGYLGQTTSWGFIATSMTIQNDGKILVAGQSFSYDPTPPDFALIRFKIDGNIDAAFGNNGVVTTDFSGYADVAKSIAIQTGGKIILAGKTMNAGGTSDFAMARYSSTGAVDQSFGTDGKVVLDFNSNDDEATSVAVQPDGKIVVAGWETVVNGSTYTNFAMARFTSKGKPDLDFGNQGKLTTDFNGYDDAATSIAIQNDGKIIAAGYAGKMPASTGYQNDLAVARYDINGVPDTTFSADKSGKVTTDAGFTEEIKASVWKNDRLYIGGNAVTIAGFAFPSYFGIAAVYKTSTISLPHLTINDVTVDEGDTAHLTVSIDQVSSSAVTVNYTTEDVTASGRGKNADYKAGRGSVVIPAGQTTAEISVATYADNLTQEGSETFHVNLALSNQMAGLVSIGDDVGLVTINDVILLMTPKAPADTDVEHTIEHLSVKAYPNPSADRFTLQLQSKQSPPVSLTISDPSGRIIETRTGLSANSSIEIGANYRPGVYYAYVVQGAEKFTVKLIKQK